MSGPGAPLRILGFGTYDLDAHPRVGVVLEGLRARGHQVRQRAFPLGLSTAQRVQMLRQPWRLPLLAARLAQRWLRLGLIAREFNGTHRPDAVVVGYLGHFDVLLARALYPRRGRGRGVRAADAPAIVLDHLIFAAGTALDRGTSEGLRTRTLRKLDEMALRAADVILLDTEEHRRTAQEVLGQDAAARALLVVPVGATQAWYAAGDRPREPRASAPGRVQRPLSVVFYGLFTPLQGTTAIAQALRLLGGGQVPMEVTVIGGGQDEQAVRDILGATQPCGQEEHVRLGPVRVHLVPWVAAEDLPQVVAGHDVCLGIAGTTAKARAVVPNKVYQGAAAGCAVVTSDTPPQRRAFGEAAVLVPPGDHQALAGALAALAADGEKLARVRQQCARAARETFAPAAGAEELEAVLLRAQRAATPGRPGAGR